jgi:UDP-glucose 4-epimerase
LPLGWLWRKKPIGSLKSKQLNQHFIEVSMSQRRSSVSLNQAKTCVVLGGGGFLGRQLCRNLVDMGFSVRSVSRSGKPQAGDEPWVSRVDWIAAPLGTEACFQALQGAEIVFHLASSTLPSSSNRDMAYDLESNLVGGVRTLEAAASSGVQRLIFISSGGTVYGDAHQLPIPEDHPTDPICSYGIHKLALEKYLHLFRLQGRLDSLVLRVANMYGESQDLSKPLGAVAHFATRAANGMPIEIWGDGSITRDYVHVDDVVSAILKAASYQGRERIFNIGSGHGISLNGLLDMLRSRLNQHVAVEYRPARGFDVATNILDVGRARRELSWVSQVSLEAGLERIIHAARLHRPAAAALL